jgi:serine/threonine-protein kinase
VIEFRALGTLALRDSNGEDINSVLAQPKRVALLAYLALARPHGFHRRDTLLAQFWPEQDEQHARWALNQALRHLRNALGREVITSRGDGEVGVDPRLLASDAVEFESAIKRSDSARALELYRGDLLDGFHVSGCGDFERWLEEERIWLRNQAAWGAWAMAERHETEGEPLAAAHWARRAALLSPDDESGARRLIELLDRMGDRSGALEYYEEFARRLREEYEAEPAPETRDLIERVRGRQHSVLAMNAGGTEGPKVMAQEAMVWPAAAAPTAHRPRRSRRPASLVLGSVILAGVGSVIWNPDLPRARSATADRTAKTIAVFPFAYRGSPEFGYLAEGLVDLLSANLNGAGDIRTIDPDAVLAQFRRVGRDRLKPEQARSLAARIGAGSYVLGTIVETGGRLRISARVQSADQKEEQDQPLVDGPSSQLFRLVDELTAQLIAQQSGGAATSLSRLAALTTDSLAALKAYLDGERHFRALRIDSSLFAFERAIRIDSSFALAHYRLATAAASGYDRPRPLANEAVERALRMAHRLSDRDRRLISALSAVLHGRVREAERLYREIVTRYPDDLEASYQLGRLVLWSSYELGRSWLDAREHFERVLSVDPYHQGSLTSLSVIATRERDGPELDSLTTRILEIVAPVGWGWLFQAQRAIVAGDTAGLTHLIEVLEKYSDDVAQPNAGGVVLFTGDLVVGRRLWRLMTEPSRSRGVRLLAHLTLAKIELMTGRWRAAEVELDSAQALDFEEGLEHRALMSLWPLQRLPRSELLRLRDLLLNWKAEGESSSESTLDIEHAPDVEHAPAHPYLRLYLLGLLSARLGYFDDAREYGAQLTRRAPTSFSPSFVEQLGRTLRAEVARGRGRANEALQIIDSLRIWIPEGLNQTRSSPFYGFEYERNLRAELLHLGGRNEDALGAYRSLADMLFHSGAPAHLRLAEIYEQRGERQKASHHYARFVELWKDCDPELQPLVLEARRRMAM